MLKLPSIFHMFFDTTNLHKILPQLSILYVESLKRFRYLSMTFRFQAEIGRGNFGSTRKTATQGEVRKDLPFVKNHMWEIKILQSLKRPRYK